MENINCCTCGAPIKPSWKNPNFISIGKIERCEYCGVTNLITFADNKYKTERSLIEAPTPYKHKTLTKQQQLAMTTLCVLFPVLFPLVYLRRKR